MDLRATGRGFCLDAIVPTTNPRVHVVAPLPIQSDRLLLRCAAFEHEDGGRCVEEFIVRSDYPASWFARLPAFAIDITMNRRLLRWARDPARRVATVAHIPHRAGEQLFVVGMNRWARKPLGAFVWWVLRVPSYKVDWPETHTFIHIDQPTGRLHGYGQAQEPVHTNERSLVIDVTGTPWEACWQRKVYGRFVLDGDTPRFEPERIAGVRRPTTQQLTEAGALLDPSLLTHRDTAYALVAQGASL